MFHELDYPKVSTQKHTEKYAKNDELTVTKPSLAFDLNFQRVAKALAAPEKDKAHWEERFLWAFRHCYTGAGRVMSAAGTDMKATLINCFVQPIGDSIDDSALNSPAIFQACQEAARTMKRGGGVGYSFDEIRPSNAKVKSVRSIASGPVSYMEPFDSMCKTIASAGDRRGAQMSVLGVNHPDILKFVTAKQEKGKLTQFNMSVGLTDDFMEALIQGKPFELFHAAEPADELIQAGAYQRTDGNWVYETIDPQELWDKISKSTYNSGEPGVLFLSTINRENNLSYLEVIRATNPCGEQPLPPYGSCNLGALILTGFISKPFTKEAYFDAELFAEVVSVAHRAQDNVLDVTYWPLEEQKKEAMSKRRIGLGITGLGNALTLMGLKYNSKEGRAFAENILRILRDESYRSSVNLAKEKGAFPLYDERYLDSPFIKRLPEDIRAGIAKHGIRNSHSLTIAPTGTISLTFGKNCSGGIEPSFSWTYNRKFKQRDGSSTQEVVEDYAYRLYKEVTGNDDPTDLPDYFVSAMDITAEDHMLMLKVSQPYIDSSISKTVNVPEDYPFEDFKTLYLEAWKSGLKGLATFRPNDITGSVLSSIDDKKKQDFDLTSPDRKISFPDMPQPALNSLDMPRRPLFANGNPSTTYMVSHPMTPFAVVIGEPDNKSIKHPFECWVNSFESPRGLSALAKIISTDMRGVDRAFLKMKLDSIAKTAGTEFDFPFPPDGEVKRVPSTVAALARIITHRCHELNDFQDGPTPLIDALISNKEPKSGTNGTLSWTVDINNPSTRDNFSMFLKEAYLEDGSSYPYSVWISGDYPEAFSGICKCLSIDMRIYDPAWVSRKLRSLTKVTEPQGDFMAKMPGQEKQQTYPSTIAYVAELILHRYRMLGILDDTNHPIGEGLFKKAISKITEDLSHVVKGKKCPSCAVHAVVRSNGCDLCSNCGEVGNCG